MNEIRNILVLCLILISKSAFGQDSINLVYQKSFACSKNSVWDVDNLGNLYLTDKDEISKFNHEGKKIFSQSVKKFGKISSLDVRNPMKIILFSEQQQTLSRYFQSRNHRQRGFDLRIFDPLKIRA